MTRNMNNIKYVVKIKRYKTNVNFFNKCFKHLNQTLDIPNMKFKGQAY